MRILTLAMIGLLFAANAPPGLCAASPVDRAFGNTILSTYPDGRTAELWLQPDGSYRAQGRRGDPSDGHWRVSGAKLCLKQAHPFPAPFRYCTAIPSGGMNRPWPAKAVTGERIRVRLVEGRSPA